MKARGETLPRSPTQKHVLVKFRLHMSDLKVEEIKLI